MVEDLSQAAELIVPIQGKWYRSAGTWAYPDGGVHRGMDFGTYSATGLSVVAPQMELLYGHIMDVPIMVILEINVEFQIRQEII